MSASDCTTVYAWATVIGAFNGISNTNPLGTFKKLRVTRLYLHIPGNRRSFDPRPENITHSFTSSRWIFETNNLLNNNQ